MRPGASRRHDLLTATSIAAVFFILIAVLFDLLFVAFSYSSRLPVSFLATPSLLIFDALNLVAIVGVIYRQQYGYLLALVLSLFPVLITLLNLTLGGPALDPSLGVPHTLGMLLLRTLVVSLASFGLYLLSRLSPDSI